MDIIKKIAEEFKREAGSLICRDILKLQEGEKTNPTPDARTPQYYANRPCLRIVGIGDKIAKQMIKKDC